MTLSASVGYNVFIRGIIMMSNIFLNAILKKVVLNVVMLRRGAEVWPWLRAY